MEVKHTRGPWRIKDDETTIMRGRKIIANAFDHGGDCDEIRANARLIAAAPDTLAALEAVQQAIIAEYGDTYQTDRTYTVELTGKTIGTIVRALLKAKGGAQ